MKRIKKKLANNVDYSNHVWMQYAEVRIVSGFGKSMLKCVVGTIMPKSNMPSACAFSSDVEV
jgi:hypothetical protein